jgi:outer membrane receptor for Fe3+-dicitrate
MRKLTRVGVAAALLALLAVPGLWAQTTGRIVGTVTDSSGAAMPGVVVTVTSPALQGAQSTTTTSSGEFRLLALPPGTYQLKVEMQGFKTVEQKDIVVGIDKTVTLPLKLAVAAMAETIQVTGESPTIDTTSATTGVVANAELFDRIPLQRTFDDVARIAAGTQQDAVGTVVYGSSGAENQYIIEGLNTTGIRSGDQTKSLNFEFVEEVEVKTGGMPAEYGRMTGGSLNVLTKSGSNQFNGNVFGFFEGKGLAADNTTAPDRPAWQTQVNKIDQKYDFGASLGGYLVKDKLWFFGAYNRVSQTNSSTVIHEITAPGTPAVGSVIPTKITTDLFAGKLTWKLTANHTITASLFGDPNTTDGAIFNISGTQDTWKGTLDQGSTDYVARYDGVLSNSFMVRAQYGRHKDKVIPGGSGRDIAQSINATVTPNALTGGFGFFSDENYTRDQARLDISKFLGSHEIKVGGDWQRINDDVLNYQGGAGQRIYELITSGTIFYRHRYYVDDLAAGYDRSDPTTWQIALPQVSRPSTTGLSAYLQDSWKVTKGFTLNLGLRWEQQDVKNRFGESAFKIKDNWAPRVGFVWDVNNNGKSKLYANYGRFYEDIPQDINIRSFGGEVVCFCYNFDPSSSNILPDPSAPRRSTLLGGPEPVDSGLKGQFINEWIGGYEYEVRPNFALGVKMTYRNLGRVIEDFLVPSEGNYFIANPGEGTLGKTLAFYDLVHTAPAPKAERKATAFELTARKRFSDNWQFLASYVWERLEGNYDGTFQNSTGQLDPNINSAFDYADFLVNAGGRLSAERQNQFKFDGSYQFKGGLDGLNIGFSTYWFSGLPLTAYGYSFAYQNWEYYLTPRGSLGRGPSYWEANLHVDYPVKLGTRQKLNLVVDIFNLFNRQSGYQLDERYNLIQDGVCAGIPEANCNGDGGLATQGDTLTPIAQLSNPRATATNPDFLKKSRRFTDPRSIRVGVRFTF